MKRIAAVSAALALMPFWESIAGTLDNTNSPAPTMVSLNELYDRITIMRQTLELPDGPPAVPGATGQTNIWRVGDDGFYRAGARANPRFTVGEHPATNTVIDNLTGLMWARMPNGNSTTWTNAMQYCEALSGDSYGYHEDWRMPNVREMESLLDYSGYDFMNEQPGLPPGHPFWFDSSFNFWTSTPGASGQFWFIDFRDRMRKLTGNSSQLRVLPVRGGMP